MSVKATTTEGLGFTGAQVRESFAYAARGLPVEMIFFDNNGNRDTALAPSARGSTQVEPYSRFSDRALGGLWATLLPFHM